MTAPITVSTDDLPLQSLYHWERERANEVYLTQPTGGGQVQDITWREAADQVRRAATWLAAQGFRVVRFPNTDIQLRDWQVIARILEIVGTPPSQP